MEKTLSKIKAQDKNKKKFNKKVVLLVFILFMVVVFGAIKNNDRYNLYDIFDYHDYTHNKGVEYNISFENVDKFIDITQMSSEYNKSVTEYNKETKEYNKTLDETEKHLKREMREKNKWSDYFGAAREVLLYGDNYRYFVKYNGRIIDMTNPDLYSSNQCAGTASSSGSGNGAASSQSTSASSGIYGSRSAASNAPLIIGKTEDIQENGFCSAVSNPLSTFSSDVDTASYSLVRRWINSDIKNKYWKNLKGAVRIEEMVNYFEYDYPEPDKNSPFGMKAVISKCPWNEENDLVMVGLRTKAYTYNKKAPSNYVFLIDVSGSMYREDKLGLLLESMEKMIRQLKRNDVISIVVYAGNDEVLLEGFKGKDKKSIRDHIKKLSASGSTNGAAGIERAYEIAEKYYIEGGNNRIILATDGDFNVGVSTDKGLIDLISEKRESGVGLSVLGFGLGNLNDRMMEKLADNGNGVYFYIDSEEEAEKVLCEELSANTTIVAKDVKFQIEFNPRFVSEYRLIGYENRVMAKEDFDNDLKDAGDMGSSRSITMMYEIKRNNGEGINEDLKYQDIVLSDDAYKDEWMTLACRYKNMNDNESYITKWAVGKANYTKHPDKDFKFAASVAEYGMILNKSDYIEYNDKSLEKIINKLSRLHLKDKYKKEFVQIVKDTDSQIKEGILHD